MARPGPSDEHSRLRRGLRVRTPRASWRSCRSDGLTGGLRATEVRRIQRPPERVRDLIDIVHCFELYASAPDARRYEIGEAEVDETPVAYDEAGGAYLLGQEVAALARPESLATVRSVLASIDDEFARSIQQILSEERRLPGDDTRRRVLYRLFRVFSARLESAA